MKKYITAFILAPVLAIALSGCALNAAGTGISLSPSAQTSLASIGTFTLADLVNAKQIALAQVPQTPQTEMDETCFTALTTFVQNQQAATNTAGGLTVSGAFSTFEVARVTAGQATTANLKALVLPLEQGCGPTFVDTQTDVATFLAGVAALGIK